MFGFRQFFSAGEAFETRGEEAYDEVARTFGGQAATLLLVDYLRRQYHDVKNVEEQVKEHLKNSPLRGKLTTHV